MYVIVCYQSIEQTQKIIIVYVLERARASKRVCAWIRVWVPKTLFAQNVKTNFILVYKQSKQSDYYMFANKYHSPCKSFVVIDFSRLTARKIWVIVAWIVCVSRCRCVPFCSLCSSSCKFTHGSNSNIKKQEQ